MSSEVDICNLALSYIGEDATVSSINPPEGSQQAAYCKTFYPMARDNILNRHNWTFASRRVVLAQVTNPYEQWEYAYALPSDCMKVISVMDAESKDDYSEDLYRVNVNRVIAERGYYTPQPFTIELDTVGNKVLYTNQEDAQMRYQAFVTDPTKFSPLFVMVLSYQMASMLAGPVIKGKQGASTSMNMLQLSQQYLSEAIENDANQDNSDIDQLTPWIVGR